MNTIKIFFSWPNGTVWSNLIASVLWATPAIFFTHRKLHKMHKRIERIHEHLIKELE